LPDTATLVQLIKDEKLKVFGELGLQYFGKVLTDPMFEPYLSICERYNIPIALHTGISFPNTPIYVAPNSELISAIPNL
jgi:Tat protein secretion system quality control protein TatD with DNase activity